MHDVIKETDLKKKVFSDLEDLKCDIVGIYVCVKLCKKSLTIPKGR
jgi:hypothetical protein